MFIKRYYLVYCQEIPKVDKFLHILIPDGKNTGVIL